MNSALKLYAVLLLLSDQTDLRYGFVNSKALHRPKNVVLHQMNFMSQHAIRVERINNSLT